MYGCQQILVNKADKELNHILVFLCEQSHKLTNMGIYYARQLFFKAGKKIGKFDLEKIYKNNNHFKVFYSQAAQQILRTVGESFNSYYGLVKAYNSGKIPDKPKIPNYRKKGGFASVSYPFQALKLKGNQIRVPLGNTCKRWFSLDSFLIPMPTNLDFQEIKELRILPKNRCFYFEFVYEKQQETFQLNPNNALGIDPGLNNWLTCVSNIGTSFIIDGRHLKSMNRWYNKQVATIKEKKPQGFWNNQLAAITEKRNRQVKDGINKAARIVINHCLDNQIGIIVFGWNRESKNEIELGQKNNSEFVPIPTARLKERIKQLCEQYGIEFVETEESYTSKCSFLDNDLLPKFGDENSKPERWRPSGKRGKKIKGKLNNLGRGGYLTANGWKINADANGAANILRKVSTTLRLNLSEVCRGVLTRPTRIYIWVTANKKTKLQGTVLACPEASLLESPCFS